MKKQYIKYTLLNDLRRRLKLNAFRRRWMKNHEESELIPMNCFPLEIVEVGKYSYGELNIVTFSSNTKLLIGDFVSIAQNVFFLLDVEHPINYISTFPWKVKMLSSKIPETFSKGNIVIEDDVWIGFGSIILSGVHIGRGAIVAAGSVVTKDVPSYSIVGGVPAKIIRYRFDIKTTSKLQEIEFKRFSEEYVKKRLSLLYTPIDDNNCEEIMQSFEGIMQ